MSKDTSYSENTFYIILHYLSPSILYIVVSPIYTITSIHILSLINSNKNFSISRFYYLVSSRYTKVLIYTILSAIIMTFSLGPPPFEKSDLFNTMGNAFGIIIRISILFLFMFTPMFIVINDTKIMKAFSDNLILILAKIKYFILSVVLFGLLHVIIINLNTMAERYYSEDISFLPSIWSFLFLTLRYAFQIFCALFYFKFFYDFKYIVDESAPISEIYSDHSYKYNKNRDNKYPLKIKHVRYVEDVCEDNTLENTVSTNPAICPKCSYDNTMEMSENENWNKCRKCNTLLK
jgi:hypothetical protein